MLVCASGRAANEIRFGVDELEEEALRRPNPRVSKSGMPSVLNEPIESLGVCMTDIVGVGGALFGAEGDFRADLRGGEGARAVMRCVPFVSSRETDAVAVEDPVTGVGAGVLGMNSVRGLGGGAGCLSRIR